MKANKISIISPYTFTLKELATHLRVSYKTMRKIVKEEKITQLTASKRNFLFSYFVLPKWIQKSLPVPKAVLA